jgi:hypothetical protein
VNAAMQYPDLELYESVESTYSFGTNAVVGTHVVLTVVENRYNQGLRCSEDQRRHRKKIAGTNKGRRGQISREDTCQESSYRSGPVGKLRSLPYFNTFAHKYALWSQTLLSSLARAFVLNRAKENQDFSDSLHATKTELQDVKPITLKATSKGKGKAKDESDPVRESLERKCAEGVAVLRRV